MAQIQIHLIHGPNLQHLGQREPETYGTLTLAEIDQAILSTAMQHGMIVRQLQSNHEGELIDALYEAQKTAHGVLINPAGYSHSSVALRDAMLAIAPLPIVEVHLTNLYQREIFRQSMITAGAARMVVMGGGVEAYLSGLYALSKLL